MGWLEEPECGPAPDGLHLPAPAHIHPRPHPRQQPPLQGHTGTKSVQNLDKLFIRLPKRPKFLQQPMSIDTI